MKVSVIAEPEIKGVTNDLVRALEKDEHEVGTNFSFDSLLDSDAVVVRPDQRTPEIYASIGYLWGLYSGSMSGLYKGDAKDIPVVALWNKPGKPPDYGFYRTIFSGNVSTGVRSAMKMLKQWDGAELPEKRKSAAMKVPHDFVVYVAGDVRNPESQQVLYEMGRLAKEVGAKPIVPPWAVDAYDPKVHYCADPCGIPEDRFCLVTSGLEDRLKLAGLESYSDGASQCLRTVDQAHVIFSRVDKPDNTGPWIEIGYAVAKGMPVLGHNRYHWKKKFGDPIFAEITKHDAQWGLDGSVDWQWSDELGRRPLWMCYSKDDFKRCAEILGGGSDVMDA